jgi:hypothetical protein
LHGFLKSHWNGQLHLPTTELASKYKKAFEKVLQILLRKDLPPIPRHQTTARTKTAKHTQF